MRTGLLILVDVRTSGNMLKRMDKIRLRGFLALVLIATFFPKMGYPAEKKIYLNFGIGGASPRYAAGSSYQGIVSAQKDDGATHAVVAVDLDVYWPIGDRFLLGFSDRAMSDSYAGGGTLKQQAITWAQLGGSAMQFTGSAPGHGFFLREDAGLAYGGTTTGFSLFPSDIEFGYAAGGGGGYAIPFSEKFKLLLQGQYLWGRIGGQPLHATVFSVSGLF
jgi:hypothetical protein